MGVIPEETGYGHELFYEEYTGRYFYSSKAAVERAEKETNTDLLIKGYARLNDFYKHLGIRTTELGSELGWVLDTDHEHLEIIEFDHMLTDIGITTIKYIRGFCIRYPILPAADYFL